MKSLILLICALFAAVSLVSGQNVETCRQWGFDPLELSCETCDILVKTKEKCLQCCQSYKTMAKSTRRYGFAVMVYPEGAGGGYMEELEGFVEHDLEEVLQQKGSSLETIEYQNSSPHVMFMDEKPEFKDANVRDKLVLYNGEAKEVISLRQWKRDDMKEMLLALLPDAS